MSYYVTMDMKTVEDANRVDYDEHRTDGTCAAWLCGWQWADFGRAMLCLGEEKEEGVATMPLKNIAGLRAVAERMLSDERYHKVRNAWTVGEGAYSDAVYNDLLGLKEPMEDEVDYANLPAETAVALRKAYLEYREEMLAANAAKRNENLLWLRGVADLADGLEEEVYDALSCEWMVPMVGFCECVARAIEEFGEDYEVEIICG